MRTTLTVEREGKPYLIGRIMGGIAWPASQPGCIVLVGEEQDPVKLYPLTYHYHVIAEYEERNTTALIRQALSYEEDYGVLGWYCKEDDDALPFLWRWNNVVRDRHVPMLRVSPAIYTKEGRVAHYIDLLNTVLNRDSKRLWPLDDGLCVRQMFHLPINKDFSDTRIDDFPALAALGYAAWKLMASPPDPYEEPADKLLDTTAHPASSMGSVYGMGA